MRMIFDEKRIPLNHKLKIGGIRKFKLVCFDLDGTLIDFHGTASSWDYLHKALGVFEQTEIVKREFFRKEICWDEWVKKDLAIWKNKNAGKENLLDIVKTAKAMPNAVETLKELKKKGLKIALISGGLSFVFENFFDRTLFDFVFINSIKFDSKGQISHCEYRVEENKGEIFRRLIEKEKLRADECVFVGDTFNDLKMLKSGCFVIAFNSPHKRFNRLADASIEKKDLREILQYI